MIKYRSPWIQQISISLVLLICFNSASAATITWTPSSNVLNDPNNWTPNLVPVIFDTAVFTNVGSHTPVKDPTLVQNFFPSQILFDPGAGKYTFRFNSAFGDNGLFMIGSGTTDTITNSSGVLQVFNFFNSANNANTNISAFVDIKFDALLRFNFSDSAEMTLAGTSMAASANFNASDSAIINVINTAQTESALFNLHNFASLMFDDSSIAGSSSPGFQTTINVFDSALLDFAGASDPNNAIIKLHQLGSVTFDTSIGTSGHGGPFLTLFNRATVNVLQDISIAKLSSQSTGATVSLGMNTLTIRQPPGAHDVYAGAITGTGTLRLNDVNPSSSLTLTSPQNPFDTWRANVVSGTLIGNTTNLNRNISIGNEGTVVLNQKSDGVYNHTLTGTGTLNVKGPANLTITSNNRFFAGTTNVRNENLVLNGSLGGKINVFTKLSGTGTATGTVEVKNGGLISPNGSNKIGTLTVGKYINNVNGKYLVNLNGSGQSDLIHATTTNTNRAGVVELEGGTVITKPLNRQFLLNVPYTIVTAQNGVFGKYTTATNISPFIRSELSYDPNHVFLTLKGNFVSGAGTHNQREVAKQIDTIKGSSGLIDALAFLTTQELQRALDELSGVQYASIIPTLQQSNQRFIRAINLPIRLNRCDPCLDPCVPEKCECEGTWGVIQYGESFTHSDRNARGWDVRTYDGFFAVQKKLSPSFTGGLAVYYEHDFIDFHLNGNAHMDTGLGSIFGVMQYDNYYLLGDLIFGYSFTKLKRRIEFDDFKRSPRGDVKMYDVAYYTEIGHNYICRPCLNMQFFAGAEIDYFYRTRFREHKGKIIALRSGEHDYKGLNSFVGVRGKIKLCGGFEIIGEAAWLCRFNNDINSIKLNFKHFGHQFEIFGPEQGRNSIFGSIILTIDAYDGRRFFAEVYGEGSERYSAYGFSLGYDWNW